MLAPAFGAAIALSFTLGWLTLNRTLTGRAVTAVGYLAIAGTLSAGLALVVVELLARRPWSARMAAALILLLAGTSGLASFFMTLRDILTFHDLSEIPIGMTILILGVSGVGAIYNVLTTAAPLILPLGLIVVGLFTLLIARKPR